MKNSGLTTISICLNPSSTQSRTFLVVTTWGMFLYLFTTQICQLPSVITMAIAATRMYRSLIDFATPATETYKDSSSLLSCSLLTVICRNSNSNISKIRWYQTPFNRIHVTVDTTHEHNQPSLTSPHDSDSEPPMNTEEQPRDSDKPHGLEPREPV
jgi:hypothetical protein